jgi:superfamily I DNA/RNA helicase
MNLSEIVLSEQQRDIVENTSGNIVVSASAGTGKTRTMTAKIIHELKNNCTHKTVAAITFTIRAAQEIRDRLAFDTSQCFVGTNNSFAIEEVIKPFMKDVYGEECDTDIDTDYANKDGRLNSLTEGIQSIKDYHTIYSYYDNKKNFVFDLALDIVKKSLACRLYLQAKYFGIYVDEYQDCDLDMHEFFMYLCDELHITTFIVGDDKQSIYRWRGANPESFKSVFQKLNFTHKVLTENHRSDKQIQDYSNLLFDETTPLVVNPQNSNNIVWIVSTNDAWASKALLLLDANMTSALLRSQNEYSSKTGKYGASDGADLLTSNGMEHIYIPPTPIDNITTSSAWLYFAIASYVLISTYSAYDFYNEIPAEAEPERIVIGKIEQMLKKARQKANDSDATGFGQSVTAIADHLGYATTADHIEKLYNTVRDSKYAVALNPIKPQHCTLTLHSSKGLEFEQVILFIEDYAYYGNVGNEHINNHYVACTRAEKRLVVVDTQSQDANAARGKIIEKIKAGGFTSRTLITPILPEENNVKP